MSRYGNQRIPDLRAMTLQDFHRYEQALDRLLARENGDGDAG